MEGDARLTSSPMAGEEEGHWALSQHLLACLWRRDIEAAERTAALLTKIAPTEEDADDADDTAEEEEKQTKVEKNEKDLKKEKNGKKNDPEGRHLTSHQILSQVREVLALLRQQQQQQHGDDNSTDEETEASESESNWEDEDDDEDDDEDEEYEEDDDEDEEDGEEEDENEKNKKIKNKERQEVAIVCGPDGVPALRLYGDGVIPQAAKGKDDAAGREAVRLRLSEALAHMALTQSKTATTTRKTIKSTKASSSSSSSSNTTTTTAIAIPASVKKGGKSQTVKEKKNAADSAMTASRRHVVVSACDSQETGPLTGNEEDYAGEADAIFAEIESEVNARMQRLAIVRKAR